ncbi:MAG: hypothetical protein J6D15_05745 [Clostridia bacterium]|nr:hypothetical protein [Clostridia bacterium]
MMKAELLNLAENVEIDGVEYKINTDFSVWIEIEQIFLLKEDGKEAAAKILSLAYPYLPHNPVAAFEKVVWFYSGGMDAEKTERKCFGAPLYDLKRDFKFLWADFLGKFGIDLLKTNMHWWQFRLLISALDDGCKFPKVVGYRSLDTAKIKNKELKNFYEKMKKQYKLPDIRTDEEREEELADILSGAF